MRVVPDWRNVDDDDAIATKLFGTTYDRDGDIVSYHRSQGHLMHAMAEPSEREASRPDVRFFCNAIPATRRVMSMSACVR